MINRIKILMILFIYLVLIISCLDIPTPTGDLTPPTGLSVDYDNTQEEYLTLNWYLIPDTNVSINDIYDGVNIYYVEYGFEYNNNQITDNKIAYEYFEYLWSSLYDNEDNINQDIVINNILNKTVPSITGDGFYNTNGKQISYEITATSLGIPIVGSNDEALFTDEKFFLCMTTVGYWGGIRLESSLSDVVLFDYSLALEK